MNQAIQTLPEIHSIPQNTNKREMIEVSDDGIHWQTVPVIGEGQLPEGSESVVFIEGLPYKVTVSVDPVFGVRHQH